MTATTEGDLHMRLAQANDEVLETSERHNAVEEFDTPLWWETYGVWKDAVDRRDAIIRQLDQGRQ